MKSNIFLINASVAPENILGKLISLKPEILIIVDAKRSQGKQPGEISIVDPADLDESYISTHGIPLRMLIETVAGSTSADVFIIGIEVDNSTISDKLSTAAQKSLDDLTNYFNGKIYNAIN
ncbi:MAG: hydrogenase maturation protease [bacterium]